MQPIAIIGAACRFPGASGLDEFWQLLRDRRSAIIPVSKERWDPDVFCDSNPNAPGKMISRFGGFVDGIKQFDCGFFGISPREATSMDPQQRMLLETAWEAFEDAEVPMDLLAGSKTAVYVGIGPGDYSRLCMQPVDQIDAYLTTGNFLSVAADRIAYFFDLRGPSMAVDTACSSSLVCVHLACRSIECGEATMALAGGVNALIAPPISISLSKAGAISPTGRCRAFDANADGYVRGEGAGFVVLKRLQDAIADGDRIYAVIRGSAINQSGRRNGLTAPGSWGEEAVMLSAWEASGIAPASVEYVEAHGTGTVLGDAIEANALGKVFGSQRNGHGPCRIGSVKTNIGHLETAAGVAGLIKVMLMISRGEFVGSLYPEVPNPHVNLEKLGLTVQKRTEPWPATTLSPRLGGVSSFGLGGTYAHVCVTGAEVASEEASAAVHTPGLLVPVSARHPDALRLLVQDFTRRFETTEESQAIEICRAAARRRTHHDYRVAFAGLSSAEVALAMDWWLQSTQAEATKVGARRNLVAVAGSRKLDHEEFLNAVRDFGANPAEVEKRAVALGDRELIPALAVLRVLGHWGVRPQRVFRLTHDHLLSELDSAAAETDNPRPVDWEKLRNAGDDFVDLTGTDSLAPLRPLPRNGRVTGGFSSSEGAKMTILRVAGELYELGYPLGWQKIYPGTVKHVSLPRYPWQQKTCWWTSSESMQLPLKIPVQSTSAALERPSIPPASPKGGLQSLLARVTGRPLQEIQPEASPNELGVDSLMTIELQDELKRQLGVLLPLDTLVNVGSVRDLEQLVEEARKSTVAEIAVAQPKVQSKPRPSTEICEATLADYEPIAALLSRNGLEVKPREEWEHLWINNPVLKKLPNCPIGWVVRNGAETVGFLGCIPVSYCFKGREIIGASFHSFCLDASHRGHGLLLLNRLLECDAAVEYLVGSTANASSSKVLERSGIPRVPTGDWENSAYWITNYAGFLESALAKRSWSKFLAYPGATVLALRDQFAKGRGPRQRHELHTCSGFDQRFAVFWEELKHAYPDRFLATRSREVLDWHFKFALKQDRAWIVTQEDGARIVAYAVFYRHDNPEINLKRIRLVDFQTLHGDRSVLVSILALGLRRCRDEGIHMLEAVGFRPDKQCVIDSVAPHRRQLPGWLYYYRTRNQALHQELQDPNVWEPSQFDGDASL